MRRWARHRQNSAARTATWRRSIPWDAVYRGRRRVLGVFFFGREGFPQPIAIKKIASGVFRGRLQIGAKQGLFRVRPLVESRAFPEAGLYRPEAELADYGSYRARCPHVAQR